IGQRQTAVRSAGLNEAAPRDSSRLTGLPSASRAASGLLAACLVDGLADGGDFQGGGAHETYTASSGFHQLGPLGYLADFQVGLTQAAPHGLSQGVPGSHYPLAIGKQLGELTHRFLVPPRKI